MAQDERPLSESPGFDSLFPTMVIRVTVRLEAINICPRGIEKKVEDRAPRENSRTVARRSRLPSFGSPKKWSPVMTSVERNWMAPRMKRTCPRCGMSM